MSAFLGVQAYLRAYGCKCRYPRVVNTARYVGCADCGIGYRSDWRGRPDANPNLQVQCHYCKAYCDQTRDHIVPRSLGGPDIVSNIVPSCAYCNGNKASKRAACSCSTCTRAWERWGPENYLETVEIWQPSSTSRLPRLPRQSPGCPPGCNPRDGNYCGGACLDEVETG